MAETLIEKLGKKIKSATHSIREYTKYRLMEICDKRFERKIEEIYGKNYRRI